MQRRLIQFALLALFVLGTARTAAAESHLDQLFSVEKPVIGALFLYLPEDLNDEEYKRKTIRYATYQMRILAEEGVDGVLWEYQAGGILDPEMTEHHIQYMTDVMTAIVQKAPEGLVVGFEVLWHYPRETLLVAHNSGAKFVRIDFFSDRMIADDVEVPIDPKSLLKYKQDIGAEDVVLFTDIQVKYATMIDDSITISQSAANAIRKGSDGVIVSGAESGQPPRASRIRDAKEGAGDSDVIIGSGFSYKNARTLLPYLDGVIVGTSISKKTGGPLVRWKVRYLMDIVRDVRN